MTKLTKWPVRPAITQIILDIDPVWSESSMCAHSVTKDSGLYSIIKFPQTTMLTFAHFIQKLYIQNFPNLS